MEFLDIAPSFSALLAVDFGPSAWLGQSKILHLSQQGPVVYSALGCALWTVRGFPFCTCHGLVCFWSGTVIGTGRSTRQGGLPEIGLADNLRRCRTAPLLRTEHIICVTLSLQIAQGPVFDPDGPLVYRLCGLGNNFIQTKAGTDYSSALVLNLVTLHG